MQYIQLGHEYFNMEHVSRVDDRGEAIMVYIGAEMFMILIEQPDQVAALRSWLTRNSANIVRPGAVANAAALPDGMTTGMSRWLDTWISGGRFAAESGLSAAFEIDHAAAVRFVSFWLSTYGNRHPRGE